MYERAQWNTSVVTQCTRDLRSCVMVHKFTSSGLRTLSALAGSLRLWSDCCASDSALYDSTTVNSLLVTAILLWYLIAQASTAMLSYAD
jgi:hypothetical protein